MTNYVSERKMTPWRGMIAVFRIQRYRKPIEGTMKTYDYICPNLATNMRAECIMKRYNVFPPNLAILDASRRPNEGLWLFSSRLAK
jgi:hypothetical protein